MMVGASLRLLAASAVCWRMSISARSVVTPSARTGTREQLANRAASNLTALPAQARKHQLRQRYCVGLHRPQTLQQHGLHQSFQCCPIQSRSPLFPPRQYWFFGDAPRRLTLDQLANLGHLLGNQHQNVVHAYKTNQRTLSIDDWKATKPSAAHSRERGLNRLVFRNRRWIARHDGFHERAARFSGLRNHPLHQVAVRHDPNGLLHLVHDDKCSNGTLSHSNGSLPSSLIRLS